MIRMLALFASALALVAEPAPTVGGTWQMGIQGDHVVPVALVLKQDGQTVTGTIALPGQQPGSRFEVDLAGEFVDHTLTLSGTFDHGGHENTIAIAGTLAKDGSLEGTVTGPHGKMSFTAERLRSTK
jgi:hypothetical protein